MRSIFIILLTLLSLTSYTQEIKDVIIKNNGWAQVILTNNQRKSGWIGNKDFEFDFSDCIIVARKENGWTEVYDKNLSKVKSGWLGNQEFKFKVIGCGIKIWKSNGWTERYDKNLKKTFSGW